MKNRIILLCLFVMASSIQFMKAQETVKRYGFIELFTNTPCPICVAQNPGFFNLLANYEDDVHQVSFYPGQPYSTCPLYQSNTSENIHRTSHRNVFSTPRVVLNGEETQSSGRITAAHLENATSGQSYLAVTVSEVLTMPRQAEVNLEVASTPTSTSTSLYVAVVEKHVTLTGIPPSWEEEHFNVFRKFLTPQTGMIVDLSIPNQSFNFSFNPSSNWDVAEIYVLAWVEDDESKSVINSGTKFDPVISAVTDYKNHFDIQIYPNPSRELISVELPKNQTLSKLQILDLSGKVIQTETQPRDIQIANLIPGIYTIVVINDKGEVGTVLFQKD